MLIVLLEYIDFLVLVKNETTIREGLTCPLPFYIAVFHYNHSYCNKLPYSKNFDSKKVRLYQVWWKKLCGLKSFCIGNAMENVKMGKTT